VSVCVQNSESNGYLSQCVIWCVGRYSSNRSSSIFSAERERAFIREMARWQVNICLPISDERALPFLSQIFIGESHFQAKNVLHLHQSLRLRGAHEMHDSLRQQLASSAFSPSSAHTFFQPAHVSRQLLALVLVLDVLPGRRDHRLAGEPHGPRRLPAPVGKAEVRGNIALGQKEAIT